MNKFDKYLPIIKKTDPGYQFSWQISTEIIEDNLLEKPYWLDIGARDNIRLKTHPQAELGVGLDIELGGRVFTDDRNSFCLGSVYDLPFKKEAFEFIASRFVFEHLAYPEKALTEIARLLKPGGTFLLETTNKNSPLILLARLIPFSIKKLIINKLFKDNPSGTYKTHYRLNTIKSYRELDLSAVKLEIDHLYIVNDVICESKLLFTISFYLFKLLRFFRLEKLYANILAVFRKA